MCGMKVSITLMAESSVGILILELKSPRSFCMLELEIKYPAQNMVKPPEAWGNWKEDS